MKILGIIPARKGSKRIPEKNTKAFLGKPLIEHVIKVAVQSKYLSSLVISTDDLNIRPIADNYPDIRFIERPADIAGDQSPAIEYVEHALKTMVAEFDMVVIIQPTSPFTSAEDIDSTIELLLNNEADSAVSVVKVEHMYHPFKLKILRENELLPYLIEENGRMAAHEIDDVYVRNGAVYVSRIQTIRDRQIIGAKCLAHVMPPERSVDINDPIDLEFAEFLAKKHNIAE